MPPSICRGPFNSVNRYWILPMRSFSTAFALQQVRPEHPSFIDVPGQVPYRRTLRQNEVKGTLPRPRNVLKTRALETPKHLTAFRLATTPEPKSTNTPGDEYSAWKHRMAKIRRDSLRESITELYARNVKRRKHLASVSLGNRRRRERLLHAPQREDERLTNPTITILNSKPQTGILPDPNREARLREKAARFQAREEAKREARKDALHTLYMNARDFITTEEQLEARIEEIFTDEPFTTHDKCDNIWEALGAPPTIQDFLKSSQNISKMALKAHQLPAVVTGERMRTIAENLTGGKMETKADQTNSS
ncbi:hypothetical protein K3495_g12667 [Podosphaera aphanis]|nr:hypothetical protein K3495_g12667 [Podosphaera aphanis]